MSDETAFRIVKEMIGQRGYSLCGEEVKDYLVYTRGDERLHLCDHVHDRIGTASYNKILENAIKHKMNHLIVLSTHKETSLVTKRIEHFTEMKMEIFIVKNCQMNITKHKYVPAHRQLTLEESDRIRDLVGERLPILLRSDPIARFYDFEPGRVVEIQRRDCVTYRVVK